MNNVFLKITLAGAVVLGGTMGGHAQSLTFNTLAGYAGQGSADGSGINGRFNGPGGVVLDTAGNMYVADTGNNTIRKISPSGVVSTLAGLAGASGSLDGTGGSARFNQPQGVAVDSGGNVYVADTGNHSIRKITAAGAVSTLAGLAGSSGTNDGAGGGARFYAPQGVAVDTATNVYVADTWNHTIRKITAGGAVSTLAGTAGMFGTTDATGSNARFYQPQGIAVDSAGNVYVGDTGNQTIRKITAGGQVSTLAGLAGNYGGADQTGSSARFYGPAGVAVDAAGKVYVADIFNHTIRKVTSSGAVSTLAGSAGNYGSVDRPGSNARFWGPQGVGVDSAGNVYVADTGNGTIRKISTTGTVSTPEGSASIGSADWAGSRARFFWPAGAAVDGAGNVYLADTANHTIRKITAAGESSTLAGSAGLAGSADGAGQNARFYGPQGVAVDSAGNVYVADTANHTVRKITTTGVVSTLAGTPGTNGVADGPGATAQFYQPQAVAVDGAGTVYVADTRNHTVRKVTASGLVSTLAGMAGAFGSTDGTNARARFNWPSGVTVDTSGNVYVADSFNHTIRMITPGGVSSTLAGLAGVWGNADGVNSSGRFFWPRGIVAAGGGVIYVADSGNHTIRKLAARGTNWTVSTVAGLTGAAGSSDGTGGSAQFCFPAGLAMSGAGSFYVADRANNTLRLGVLIANGAPAIVSQPQGLVVDPGSTVSFAVTATGADPLTYQWRQNGTNIPGATASSYSRANVQSVDTGDYSVVVANAIGSVSSADAQLSLNGPPRIVAQPQGVTVAIGQGASFSVLASGSNPLAYQWRFNGVDIPGATDPVFALAAARGTNDGPYSVAVTNDFGMAVSDDALLAVLALQSWGDNSSGQSIVPAAATEAVAVAAGGWHNVILRNDGTVVAWGENSQGQCNVPASLRDALAIAAGGYHSLAIRANGTVEAWGDNSTGQTNVPIELAHFTGISAGFWHSLALRADGTVVAWGDNTWGQCNVPNQLTNVVAVAAGGNHSLALRIDGTVAAWGDNSDSDGIYAGQSAVPPGLTNVVGLAAGDYHSVAFLADGSVVAWGDNSQGQSSVPSGLSNVVALAAGGAHTLALESDGSIAGWGANWNGQCNLPTITQDFVGLAAGEQHSLTLIASAQPLPRLWQPSWRSGRFSAWAQTLNRMHYALEFEPMLPGNNWIPLSTNSGNGALKMLSDPSAAAPLRFYRLRPQ